MATGPRVTEVTFEAPHSVLRVRRPATAIVVLVISGTRWLAKNKGRLLGIHMLTASRFVQLTANFVRNFAELGELMRIYTEPGVFDAELDAALARGRR